MLNQIQEEIAVSIFLDGNKKAKARAILSSHMSGFQNAVAGVFVLCFSGALAWLGGGEKLQIPIWALCALAVGVSLGVTNAIDLWATRRRLEAVITLLELSKAADK